MKNFRMIVCCVIVFFAVSIPRGYELLWAQDLWGDINSDGSVNDADTQKLTACILGNGACKYCDLNTDGQYNIVDVQLLTNAIDVDKFCNNPTDIPKTECVALGSLYYSTNGADWTNQSNWMSSYTVCSWYGVTCMTDSVSGLNLSNNDLRGSIPDQLENLTNVQTLNLNTNQLIGTIPSQLGTLNKLQTLDLSNNQLTGNIPSELGNLQLNLHTLDLSHNQLTGTVPLSLGNLTVNLYTLNLSDNQLNEGIPQQLGNLSNLQMLDLSNNQLTGNIPTELSTLSMLQTLNLSGNQLSGTISPQLANLSNLRYLYLNANQLTGSIPPELGNLGRLSILNLANTQLGNSLPANLTNLGALTPAHTLSSFAFNSTNLCEPTDSTFQTWLGGIATLQRTNVACQANDYYAYKQYGGAVHDVDATESGDTNMCWAFSGHWFRIIEFCSLPSINHYPS